jgi:hypothetical protein
VCQCLCVCVCVCARACILRAGSTVTKYGRICVHTCANVVWWHVSCVCSNFQVFLLYMCTPVYICAYILCTCVHTTSFVRTCMSYRTCMYTLAYTRAHMHVHTRVHARAHDIHIYTLAYMRTYTRTHAHDMKLCLVEYVRADSDAPRHAAPCIASAVVPCRFEVNEDNPKMYQTHSIYKYRQPSAI